MILRHPPVSALIPLRPTLTAVRRAAADCQACEWWKRGMQTVFGQEANRARPMLIGKVHPSSLSGASDADTRHRETERFIDDVRLVACALSNRPSQSEK
jgi:hypothetical protein